jgi:hypothetical protein
VRGLREKNIPWSSSSISTFFLATNLITDLAPFIRLADHRPMLCAAVNEDHPCDQLFMN